MIHMCEGTSLSNQTDAGYRGGSPLFGLNCF